MSKWGEFPNGIIPNFRRIRGNLAELMEDFPYIDKDGNPHNAEKGLIFDGGSTPRLTRSVSAGPWDDDIIGPATIHDWYCKLGREGISPYPSSHVHRLFYECLKCVRVNEVRARMRYLAVYNFGPRFKANTDSIPPSILDARTEEAKIISLHEHK